MADKKTVTQFSLFGEPEVSTVKKPRKKMTDAEKAQRKAEREEKKKIEADKKWAEKWAERGVFQGELFGESFDRLVNEAIDKYLNENVEKADIEIKPENKGKFNATKKRTGKSTEELTHSKNPVTKKRAIFA